MTDVDPGWPSFRASAMFGVPNLLPVALAFLSAPVLIHALGPDMWGQLIAAQVLGGFGAVAVGLGWPVLGPTAVATYDRERQPDLIAASLRPRVIALALTMGPVLAISALVLDSWLVTSGLALAVTLNGLSSQWYFVGAVEPWRLVLLDTFPRSLGVISGVVAVAFHGGAGLYVLCVAAGITAAVVLPPLIVLRNHRRAPVSTKRGDRASSTITSVVANCYIGAPLIAVTLLRPDSLPVYAMADRLYAVAILCLATYIQSLQGWVPADKSPDNQRATRGLRTSLGLSAVVAIGLFLGIPPAGSILSAGNIAVPLTVSGGLALAAAFVVLSQYIGLVVLASHGHVRTVAVSTVVGAVVGLPLIFALAALAGAPGATWAFAASEFAVLAVQWRRLRTLGLLRHSVG